MFRSELPNYTAERYYLLSEIEEKSEFYYVLDYEIKAKLNMDSIQSLHSLDKLTGDRMAIYIVWNKKTGPENLINKVNSIVDYLNALDRLNENFHHKYLIAIEIYDADESSDREQDVINSVLQSAYTYIQSKFPSFGAIVFGISNHPGGTCALESIMDYCHGVGGHNTDNDSDSTSTNQNDDKVAVISISDKEFLGLEEDREPDAISGIYQYVLSSVNMSIEQWTKNIFNSPSSSSHLLKGKRMEPKSLFSSQVSLIIMTMFVIIAILYQVFQQRIDELITSYRLSKVD